MNPSPPDPSNTQISTPNKGGAIRLIGDTQYFPNSTRILYWPSQTCRIIFFLILLEISDAATADTFKPSHWICTEMPQIMGSYHSADMG